MATELKPEGSNRSFRVGVVLPANELGGDVLAIRDYAQAAEAVGFSHLHAYDHVVTPNIEHRPDWPNPFVTHRTLFEEPLVLFAWLAGYTRTIGFASSVIVLPQRQTALFAKQSACVDRFCGGRLRLGVGIGWCQPEYEALGVPFARRGARMDQQITLLRQLWTEPSLACDNGFDRIDNMGIAPAPLQRPIPIWIGGTSRAAMQRVASAGDGWISLFQRMSLDQAQETMGNLSKMLMQSGRSAGAVEVENLVALGLVGGEVRSIDAAVAEAECWRRAGAAGIVLDLSHMGLGNVAEHIDSLRHVAATLELRSPVS